VKALPYPHYHSSIRRCYVAVTNAARAELEARQRALEEAAEKQRNNDKEPGK
jgi:hypothetical protein